MMEKRWMTRKEVEDGKVGDEKVERGVRDSIKGFMR